MAEPVLTRRARLECVRDRLADLLVTADEARAPALSKEYRAILSELELLGGAKKGAKSDDLAAKRARRLAKPKGADSSEVSQ